MAKAKKAVVSRFFVVDHCSDGELFVYDSQPKMAEAFRAGQFGDDPDVTIVVGYRLMCTQKLSYTFEAESTEADE